MDASTCLYMYCNVEKNIMKNKYGSPDFHIQGEIFVYIYFMFYDLSIIYFTFLRIHFLVIFVHG